MLRLNGCVTNISFTSHTPRYRQKKKADRKEKMIKSDWVLRQSFWRLFYDRWTWKWSSAHVYAWGCKKCCKPQFCLWRVSIKPRLPFPNPQCVFCFQGQCFWCLVSWLLSTIVCHFVLFHKDRKKKTDELEEVMKLGWVRGKGNEMQKQKYKLAPY